MQPINNIYQTRPCAYTALFLKCFRETRHFKDQHKSGFRARVQLHKYLLTIVTGDLATTQHLTDSINTYTSLLQGRVDEGMQCTYLVFTYVCPMEFMGLEFPIAMRCVMMSKIILRYFSPHQIWRNSRQITSQNGRINIKMQ